MFLILLVVQLFLVPSALLNVVPDIQITCNLPTAEFGEPTYLTCDFGVDMQLSRQNFEIVHNGNHSVLTCLYDSDSVECIVDVKYEFDYVITDKVSLKFPETNEHHNGGYICKNLGSETETIQPCSFRAKEINSSCSNQEIEYGQRTNLTCTFSKNVGSLKKNIQIVYTSFRETKPILTCLWDSETLDCIVHNLYNFNYNISDTVSLDIDAATESHAGTYTCNILDNGIANGGNCTLSLSVTIPESTLAVTRSSSNKPAGTCAHAGNFYCILIMTVLYSCAINFYFSAL